MALGASGEPLFAEQFQSIVSNIGKSHHGQA